MPLRDRVLGRLIIDWDTGCWNWSLALDRKGYGTITIKGRSYGVHRVTYEMLAGPIPEGLELDHLCRNHACSNPAHLEPVTHRENQRRGEGFVGRRSRQTHCIRGHEFTHANTYVRRNGTRQCRACVRLAQAAA